MFTTQRMAEEAKQKLVTGNYADALPLLNRATLYAVQLMDRADPFFVQLKSDITGWYNSRAFPITDEGKAAQPLHSASPRSIDVVSCVVCVSCRVVVVSCALRIKATTGSTRRWARCWRRPLR